MNEESKPKKLAIQIRKSSKGYWTPDGLDTKYVIRELRSLEFYYPALTTFLDLLRAGF